MEKINQPEYWQRGPLPEIPPLLQPVAHALLQAREEVCDSMVEFPVDYLFDRPENMASCAYHLQHITGVLDRLFTYAREKSLSEEQLTYLELEGKISSGLNTKNLIDLFSEQVDKAILQLKSTETDTLTNYRPIGRRALPSTVIGLLFHAAEHIMRHIGQLYVTSRIVLTSRASSVKFTE